MAAVAAPIDAAKLQPVLGPGLGASRTLPAAAS